MLTDSATSVDFLFSYADCPHAELFFLCLDSRSKSLNDAITQCKAFPRADAKMLELVDVSTALVAMRQALIKSEWGKPSTWTEICVYLEGLEYTEEVELKEAQAEFDDCQKGLELNMSSALNSGASHKTAKGWCVTRESKSVP